ncbi:beta-1,6-glucan boisynthesis protein-like protein [Plenodomus tracheiphilus IPT5]|uniref:Beta-1,6-glucan boisynthesis protein-like protein n=1 Tax=Plenodomus tracheiphilus IPT5 TaxID=1408161 RepID=A0A6A7AY34_9PLEO|nr:beta-1,6-glucan boisynthesis protein-like protein [Plenodomus tracheiphilus IPT5]
MARFFISLAALAALAPLAIAGISFTEPAAGAKLTAGSALSAKWEEGGDGPALADLLSYQLFLIAGGNDPSEQIQVAVITTQGTFATGSTASGMVPAGAGGKTDKPAYLHSFLKMVAVAKAGGQLTTYSDRFVYTGMTGVFPAAVQSALPDISGTAGPKTVDETGKNNAVPDPAGGQYDMEYTMQTGLTRYAPMQPIPPTRITATNTKPLYPSSNVVIATTNLPIPKVQTTLTQSQTFSVESRENTVAPAPNPTDDMAKFLNRWKD